MDLEFAMIIGSMPHIVEVVEIIRGAKGLAKACSSLSFLIKSIGLEKVLDSGAAITSRGDSSPGIISKCLTTSTSYEIPVFCSNVSIMLWLRPKSMQLNAY
jgi:hypothetical protein